MSYEIIGRLARIEEKFDLLTKVIGLEGFPNSKERSTSLEGLLHLIEGNRPDRCGLNALGQAGIKTVEDVLAKEPQQLLAIRGFGKSALANLEAQLESKGYSREAWNMKGSTDRSSRPQLKTQQTTTNYNVQ